MKNKIKNYGWCWRISSVLPKIKGEPSYNTLPTLVLGACSKEFSIFQCHFQLVYWSTTLKPPCWRLCIIIWIKSELPLVSADLLTTLINTFDASSFQDSIPEEEIGMGQYGLVASIDQWPFTTASNILYSLQRLLKFYSLEPLTLDGEGVGTWGATEGTRTMSKSLSRSLCTP